MRELALRPFGVCEDVCCMGGRGMVGLCAHGSIEKHDHSHRHEEAACEYAGATSALSIEGEDSFCGALAMGEEGCAAHLPPVQKATPISMMGFG